MKTTVILIIKREIIHNKIPYIQSFTWFIFIVPRSKICYIKNVLYSIFITGCNIAIFFNQKSYMHGSFGNTGSHNYAIWVLI